MDGRSGRTGLTGGWCIGRSGSRRRPISGLTAGGDQEGKLERAVEGVGEVVVEGLVRCEGKEGEREDGEDGAADELEDRGGQEGDGGNAPRRSNEGVGYVEQKLEADERNETGRGIQEAGGAELADSMEGHAGGGEDDGGGQDEHGDGPWMRTGSARR